MLRTLDELGQGVERVTALGVTPLDRFLIRRLGAPVRLANEDHPSWSKGPLQQLDGPPHPAADPRGTQARRDVDRIGGNPLGGVVVGERDSIRDSEL